MKEGYTYILSNKARTVLYIGVTNDLIKRIYEHRFEKSSKFTTTFKCYYLMAFEYFERIEDAITKEKQMKFWKRSWKMEWIYNQNPNFIDLYPLLMDESFNYKEPISGKDLINILSKNLKLD
ncbi:MAG: GIY-YIG nuclease family protein [Ignavibacteria bacterium]|nr:GIY-YIG nuclease family protein [Bacteroidota bacterium]NCS80819.1 GIY-YIG nuclease family protein [Ignavibacteria bacterium]